MPLTEKELIENSWPLGLASEGNQSLDEDNLCCFTNEALQVIHSKDRTIWLTRAMRARDIQSADAFSYYCQEGKLLHIKTYKQWCKIWQLVERKCLEKAKEFK